MNNKGIEGTYYKITGEEYWNKQLSAIQGEILAYILENHNVSFKSIQHYWSFETLSLMSAMQDLMSKGLVMKVPTKKQVEELQLLNPGWVLTEAEERQAKIQEKTIEIHALGEEYSRKRRELNRIFEKQEKAKLELSKLSKEENEFYHAERN